MYIYMYIYVYIYIHTYIYICIYVLSSSRNTVSVGGPAEGRRELSEAEDAFEQAVGQVAAERCFSALLLASVELSDTKVYAP